VDALRLSTLRTSKAEGLSFLFIFGTLFERGLDPAARAPLGAHYTDTGTIEKLIRPVITEPLLSEWAATKAEILDNLVAKPKKAKVTYQTFLLRLNRFRVLDPACGSGNFLYLALKALRDIEKQVHIEALELGQPAELSMQTGPHNILGLEINEFAAELARVTVWIGDIQWCRRNGYPHAINPILKPLDGIEHRDALLVIPAQAGEGAVVEADWPEADVVVGNPPFLGDKMMRGELGHDYVETLRRVYAGRVPGGADLVTYWFEKARAQTEAGKLTAAGLVATNSIRGGANRKVLERIVASSRIFEAWSDEPWVNEGAAVRVSLLCFGSTRPVGWVSRRGFAGVTQHSEAAAPDVGLRDKAANPTYESLLDGEPVASIHADLTAGEGVNLSDAKPLAENKQASFQGSQKIGAFDIEGCLARSWLHLPNPNGQANSSVLKPSWNGLDLTRRPRDGWIIDFGTKMKEADASLFEAPFGCVEAQVKPERMRNNREAYRKYWWRHGEPRVAMRGAIAGLTRYIATPHVSKHRIFIWLDSSVLPDKMLIVIARADDTTFGILHSRFHEIWSLRMGTSLEDRPRYTSTTTFETFPFPAGLTPRDTAIVGWAEPGEAQQGTPEPPASVGLRASAQPTGTNAHPHADAIAAAAKRLNQLRENWLNPPEWVDWVITPEEEKAGFPKRPQAKPGHEAELKKRTLTNLYNAKSAGKAAWLDMAHKQLDQAVAAAYGWTDYTPEMPDEEILRRLLALNLDRAARPATP
jgi:hypothetical protein